MKTLVVGIVLLGSVLSWGRPSSAAEPVGPICIHASGGYVAALLLFATPLPFSQVALNGFRHWGPTLPVYGSALLFDDGSTVFALTVGSEPTPPFTPTIFLSGRLDLKSGLGVGRCASDAASSPCTADSPVTYTLVDCSNRDYPS